MELGATQPRAECHSVTQEPVAEPDSSLLACAQQSPSTDARWWCRGAQRSLQVLSRHPGGPPALRALRPPVGRRKAFLQGAERSAGPGCRPEASESEVSGAPAHSFYPPLMQRTSWTLAAPFKEQHHHSGPSDSIANNYSLTARVIKRLIGADQAADRC